MKEFSKNVFGQALQEEELCIEDLRRELFIRNRRGVSLAVLPARVDALAGEVSAHRKNFASLSGGVAAYKTEIAYLGDYVAGLTSSFGAYKLLRSGL